MQEYVLFLYFYFFCRYSLFFLSMTRSTHGEGRTGKNRPPYQPSYQPLYQPST